VLDLLFLAGFHSRRGNRATLPRTPPAASIERKGGDHVLCRRPSSSSCHRSFFLKFYKVRANIHAPFTRPNDLIFKMLAPSAQRANSRRLKMFAKIFYKMTISVQVI
jgi:hypothetical protein